MEDTHKEGTKFVETHGRVSSSLTVLINQIIMKNGIIKLIINIFFVRFMNEWDDPIWDKVKKYDVGFGKRPDTLLPLKETIEYLDCEDSAIKSINEIIEFKNLRVLNISSTSLISLNGIENLSNLEILFADFEEFNDISPIAKLSKLRLLDLTCNQIGLVEVSALVYLQNLERLYLANNSINSITALLKPTNLVWLTISNTLVPKKQIKAFKKLNTKCTVK